MAEAPDTARLDEILAHGPWVRRLARRLLDDPSLVDDVLQETWMVAMAGGPRDRSRTRGWLAGVVRNVVRRTRRTERRRRERETRVAPTTDAATTRDVVAEAELHGRVTRAVLALPEPYRETLLLRYFEELDAAAIADRIGTNASTVRNRHRRALVLLRDALDAEHDGDRAAWCRALLPLALAAPGGVGAAGGATGASSTAGSVGAAPGASSHGASLSSLAGPSRSVPWKEVLLMSGAKKAAVATLALVVAGTAWWALPKEPAAVGGATPVVRAPVAPGAVEPTTPEAASAVETLAAPAPVVAVAAPTPDAPADDLPGTPVRFTGRVVDTAGRPVAGATMTYVPDAHTLVTWGHSLFALMRVLPELELPTTRTGANGRYVLVGRWVDAAPGERTQHPIINPLGFPEVHASGAGIARTAHVVYGFMGGDLALPDLVVEAGGRVTGRVVDEDRAPIPGTRISGLTPVREYGENSEDVGQKGHAQSFLVATSGADGRWTIEGTGTCGGWLRFAADGYLPADSGGTVRTAPGEVVNHGDTVLARGGLLAGRVVDVDGHPVAGAHVKANDSDLGHYDRGTDTILYQVFSPGFPVAGDGTFELSALEGGTHTLWASAPGFEPTRVEGLALGRRDIVVVLEREGQLLVDVLDDATGAAIPGATLAATRGTGIDDHPPALEVEDRAARASGRFRVGRPGRVSTQLTASAPGYATRREDAPGVAVGATGRHVVRLVPEAVLAGVLVDASGAPVAGGSVTLHRVPETTPEPPAATQGIGMSAFHARRAWEEHLVALDLHARTDDAGAFRFEALRDGTYEVSARATGHAPSPVVERTLAAGDLVDDVRVELPPSGAVAGVVLGTDGAPARGEGVGVYRPGVETLSASTQTDRDGRYRIDGLEPGTWRVQVYPSVVREFTVVADETTELPLTLGARPLLTGTVVDPRTGAGVPGARVELGSFRETDGKRWWSQSGSTKTDDDGRFRFDDLHAGTRLLVASLPGGAASTPLPVGLDWGEERDIDVPLGSAHVAGRVVTPDGSAPRSSMLKLRGAGTGYEFLPCESDGTFVLDHVAPGSYGLSAFATDSYHVGPQEIVVPPGGLDDLVVHVAPAASLVCTVRLANGQPVEELTQVQVVRPGTHDDVSWARTEQGRVELERIPPGRYDLIVGDLGNAKHYADDDAFVRWREPITLVGGERRELEIVVER